LAIPSLLVVGVALNIVPVALVVVSTALLSSGIFTTKPFLKSISLSFFLQETSAVISATIINHLFMKNNLPLNVFAKNYFIAEIKNPVRIFFFLQDLKIICV
jgi:hypothetical protein